MKTRIRLISPSYRRVYLHFFFAPIYFPLSLPPPAGVRNPPESGSVIPNRRVVRKNSPARSFRRPFKTSDRPRRNKLRDARRKKRPKLRPSGGPYFMYARTISFKKKKTIRHCAEKKIGRHKSSRILLRACTGRPARLTGRRFSYTNA